MAELMTEDQVYEVLVKTVVLLGSQKEAANHWGVSAQYLNDILYRRRAPSKRILQALGLKRIVLYQKGESDGQNTD